MPSIYEDEEGHLRAIVDHLGHGLEPSILIGGWATWIRVGGEISYDIDLIIDDRARAKLRDLVDDLSQNSVHQGRKLRGTVQGIHVDIYVPYESQLGTRLRLRVEDLARFTSNDVHEGWRLLTLEAHVITKMAALLDRPDSPKGEKDANELLALLNEEVDADGAVTVLMKCVAGAVEDVPGHIERAFKLVAERSRANKSERRALERMRRLWLDAAQIQAQKASAPVTRPRLRG